MIREVKFESQDRRINQILAVLNENGIASIEEANAICDQYGLDPYMTCEETQPICFENAKWAYVVGWLSLLTCHIRIKTILIADCVCLLDRSDTVLVEYSEDLRHTAVLAFEFYFSNHIVFPPYYS